MHKILIYIFAICTITFFIQSCSSTKFVPEGEYLLASATVKSDKKVISSMEMESYIKQKPNYKTFAIFKLPLFIYNLAGKDTTKWVNRTLRNAGDAPVLYDSTMLYLTANNLKHVMINRGYLNAEITPTVEFNKKKAKVTYNIKAGEPYKIDNYKIEVKDSILSNPIFTIPRNKKTKGSEKTMIPTPLNLDSILYRSSLVKKNSTFNLDVLDQERERISSIFRRAGYYAFNKEYIGFEADTTLGNNLVNLDLAIYPYNQSVDQNGQQITIPHRQYRVKSVELYVDYNPLEDGNINQYKETKVYEKNGYKIKYGPRGEYIKPFVILENCYIVPGTLYDENMTAMTYSALSQLHILKNVNITWENDSTDLRCIITCVPDKKQGIMAEIEGTNSGGYFGVGTGIGYLHRNAFRGSEQFNIGLRGAVETIPPTSQGFSENYFEIGGETSLTFPRFMFPFLDKDFRRSIHASTQFNSSYTYQRRPGLFTRTVLSTGIKYIWQDRRLSLNRHTFDLIDISYIHLPKNALDTSFYNDLSAAARQYSFSDHFIMSMGYTFSRTNVASPNRRNQPIYSLRASIETAGNILSLAAAIAGTEKDSIIGSKQIFGTNYAQYIRGTIDYSKTYQVDEKNSIAWHVGGGLAYPYGNSKQIPIQKRFFSGGANSVRGWGIRELGPGAYYFKANHENNSDKDNFYYHSGDIRFDASIEYRSKLFWVLELAAFIDAGNIWTIKDYEKQEEGSFKFNKFYKEIAVAWGLGFRFDFDFVLVRLDCGWKAYDPSNNPNTRRWPITEPFKINKNTAWHIAVGYPF
ncbi:BamA/TamA family outer membrane protein [Dysgonomonas sp. Marseille-P4677]|uniref:translocation and assembly module lipoprotein TamL n=1 Tax=Dysgonomonas sp. Marseille-P4677 TaxID=2364790 RepID=UPI001913DF56|nr:BamA/TamA family outer membrane protein [Dysgonomonas sp. Marseille-P4677]MBK5720312.1 BamA/TamA family outer membrane protein [Dysgonomonas sp. Marseille-P4677]